MASCDAPRWDLLGDLAEREEFFPVECNHGAVVSCLCDQGTPMGSVWSGDCRNRRDVAGRVRLPGTP